MSSSQSPYSLDLLTESITTPILWGDMDAYGHVNNTVYLRWFEEVRVRMFSKFLPDNILHMIVKTEINYRSAIKHPGRVNTLCSVTKTGNTSLTIDFKIFQEEADNIKPESTVCDGHGVIVLWDNDLQEKRLIRDFFT